MAASSSVIAVVVGAALDVVGEEVVVTTGVVGLTPPPPVVHAPSVTAPATNGITAHLSPPRFIDVLALRPPPRQLRPTRHTSGSW
ncbi:MAG: hypothetical protein V9G15_09305 [Dermatophilaceae bacterium]|nr:hypothetical protein [Actinomycetales bacterium]